jgi:hypothetical protein
MICSDGAIFIILGTMTLPEFTNLHYIYNKLDYFLTNSFKINIIDTNKNISPLHHWRYADVYSVAHAENICESVF